MARMDDPYEGRDIGEDYFREQAQEEVKQGLAHLAAHPMDEMMAELGYVRVDPDSGISREAAERLRAAGIKPPRNAWRHKSEVEGAEFGAHGRQREPQIPQVGKPDLGGEV